MPPAALEAMGVRRPVGSAGRPGRLPSPARWRSAPYLSPSGVPVIPAGVPQVRGPGRRHLPDDSEGRRGISPTSLGRILQPDVCGPKSYRRLAPHHRLILSQRLRQEDKVPHGDPGDRPPVTTPGRLANLFGFKGRLLPGPGAPKVSASPPLRVARKSLAVPRSLLWTHHRPLRLYSSHGCRLIASPHTGYPPLEVLGRLARGRGRQGDAPPPPRLDPGVVPRTGHRRELHQVGLDSLQDNNLSGNGLGHVDCPGPSIQQETFSTCRDPHGVSPTPQPAGQAVAETPGPHDFRGETDRGRPRQDAVSPILPAISLVPRGIPLHSGFYIAPRPSRPGMVVKSGQLAAGNTVPRTAPGPPTVHRCLVPGVGRPPVRSPGVGTLVQGGTPASHQPLGAGSCQPRSPSLPRPSGGSLCTSEVGQCDDSGLYKEAGWNSLVEPLPGDPPTSPLDPGAGHPPLGQLPPRLSKRDRRPTESTGTNNRLRMDTPPRRLSPAVEVVGSATRGLVRDPADSPSAHLRFDSPGPKLDGDRRLLTLVEPSVGLRVSPLRSDTEDTQPDQGVHRSGDDPRGPLVADQGVVPGLVGPLRRPASPAPRLEVAPPPAPLQPVPRRLRQFKASRLEAFKSALRKKGFSKDAAQRMASSVRRSTANNYGSKWTAFVNWLAGRQIDRRDVSIPTVADFLLHLVTDLQLSPSAVKGYRAALAPVLKLHGIDISNSPEISALVRNFDINAPTSRSVTPRWDVTLILRRLQRPPYEPLATASARDLTLKTVFLLALASAKRASDLHGLSYVVNNRNDWGAAVLTYRPDFIAKTQDPARPDTAPRPFEIPALSPLLGFDDEDRLLCPVRALREYVARTARHRPQCRGLFVTTNSASPKHVAKNTVSFWLRDVIRSAYSDVPPDLVAQCRLVPHETRAIATTLAFRENRAIREIMDAACWRCNSSKQLHFTHS